VHIIETTAPIPAKCCTTIKTTKYSAWVVQSRAKQIQDEEGRHIEKNDKLPNLSNALTDRHEIWQVDAI